MNSERYNVSTLGQFVGQELGVSDWLTEQGQQHLVSALLQTKIALLEQERKAAAS